MKDLSNEIGTRGLHSWQKPEDQNERRGIIEKDEITIGPTINPLVPFVLV